MKSKILFLFLIIGVYMSPYSFSDEARIYFTNWSYTRRHSFSEDYIRQNPDINIQIYDEVELIRLRNCLTSNLVECDEIYNHVDIVIDIISDGDIVETYIINKFAFYRKGEDKIFITPAIILQRYTLYHGIPPRR